MSAKVDAALATISAAVEKHRPAKVFALFSGGHDSLCATAIAARHPAFSGVVHVNTGIGIEETREFVRETCRRQGWPLIEKRTAPEVYDGLVLKGGFPYGRRLHVVTYALLKERMLDELIREHKRDRADRIVLLTGARREESTRRMGTVEVERRDGATVWVNHIHDWTAFDRLPFIESEGLARNPVVDRLHMSGECLCGAFAKRGELDVLGAWFPRAADRILDLERRAAEAGVWCRWGERAPRKIAKEQGRFWLDALPMVPRRRVGLLCRACGLAGAAA